MLVNISYSIDFEEVPEKVGEFLHEIQGFVQSSAPAMVESIIEKLDQANLTECIREIDEMRELLVKADMRLNDCSSILRGYAKELIEPAQAHAHPTNGEVPHTDVSSLQQDLTKLRDSLREESIEN